MKKSQVFNNAKWIILCKIIQSLLQLIIGMLCARYLGPSNYGLINYAASIVAFVLPLMKLGFDATLVHELVENSDKEGEIMGTAMGLNILSALACILGVAGFSALANPNEPTTVIVCILYSISVLFSALEMMQYWFQYKLLSKYSSIIMLLSYVVVTAYRIFLLATEKSVYWFALTHSLDFGIIGLGLFAVYFKKGAQRLSFSLNRGKTMLAKSKNYILAALLVTVIQNTDHIMLTNMAGNTENGFYSAAITCATVAQFVYVAIIDSFRPLILENKKTNSAAYETHLSQLYCIIIYMALAQGIVFTLLASPIVHILYGAEYAAAVPVLRVMVWFVGFSLMGAVRNIWILAEEKHKYLWRINFSGVVFNIALNAVLIPTLGACGAAVASLLTQFLINFVFGFVFKAIRENNRLLLQGLHPKFLSCGLRDIYKAIRKK